MTEPGRYSGSGPTGSVLLPETVRLRCVALAADALGRIPADQLPVPLRRVASFAAVRRARLAGSQIAAALESDEGFRERVAKQVRIVVPDLAAALDAGTPPPAADPVEAAAVAYLLGADGWEELVEAARQARPGTDNPDRTDALERLQRQLNEARTGLRSTRDRAKQQLGEVKRDNSELRRKLAEARQRLAAAEDAVRDAVVAQDAARKQTAGLEAEARRLRARVAELEAGSTASRRAMRDDRESASRRARLLLDTLLGSAQGLRRELALPPVSGTPADTVPGAVPEEGPMSSGAGMALPTDDPALLQELLVLPGVHVVIDGYNVTKTAWSSAPLESQRSRLLGGLASVVARSRAEVTVVFDGADLTERPPVKPPRGVRVMFSQPGVIADDLIRDLLDAEPGGRPVVVVSSDKEVATDAYQAGARSVDAVALVRLLTPS